MPESTGLVEMIRIPLNSSVYPEVVIPKVPFPVPSAEVLALAATGERGLVRAASKWSRDAFVADGDGVRLTLSVFAAKAALASGKTALEVSEETADIDGYLRSRVVFDHPERFAPEHRNDTCDTCKKVGPGWVFLAPDAMLTPSEVLFLCDEHAAPMLPRESAAG